MAKDISEIFSQAVDRFRAQRDHESGQDRSLTALERSFESIKDQVRKLKPHIETHPRVNYFWIFTDKIIIGFRTGPNQPVIQLTVRLYHSRNNPFKQGIYGYLPDGYEMPLASADEAVEFIAIQCGRILA